MGWGKVRDVGKYKAHLGNYFLTKGKGAFWFVVEEQDRRGERQGSPAYSLRLILQNESGEMR